MERPPNVDEIVLRCGEPESRVRLALENIQELESLDQDPDGFGDPERRLAASLHEPSKAPPTVLERLAADDQVVSLLMELTDRESVVVKRYYGLEGTGEGNLAEIGRSMHLSRERVRQIKSSALRHLRHKAYEEDQIHLVDILGWSTVGDEEHALT